LRGTARSGAREIDKEAKVSEDEKHDETEVEAHTTRRVARNDEPADESRRAEGDHGEDDDEVEAHNLRRVAGPRRIA
jgi:hypothetical protein